MISMDLKGITWVGHVYKKFETMCLEVEEIMYQDTVKYVENQVQTVGTSVKKFYSDVMQDILPPSSMDLVKGVAAPNLVAEQHHDVGIYKKPKVGMKEDAVKIDNKLLTEDSNVDADMNKDASQEASFHGFVIEDAQSSSGNSGEYSDLHSNIYNDRSMRDEMSLSVKKIPSERPSETFGAITHTEKNICQTPSFYGLDNTHEPLCAQVALIPTPAAVQPTGFNSMEEICNDLESENKGMPDGSAASPPYEDYNQIENRSAHSSYDGESENGFSADGDEHPCKFLDKGIFVCRAGQADDLSTDTIQSSIVVEQELETIQPVESFQMEETCVVVSGDELYFVPQKEGTHKPYKKKIRDAITSRMRSARKQEYKQLAVRYGEDVKSNKEVAGISMPTKLVEGTKRSASPDSCELDWELL